MKKLLTLAFVLFSLTVLYYWRSRDLLLQLKYDLIQDNPYIDSSEEIDLILANFKSISYDEMDKIYLEQTQQDIAPFKGMLENATYYKIPQKSVYQKIVGGFRIKDFVPKDHYYKTALYSRTDSLYWLIDPKLLQLVLKFQEKLEENGHNKNAFIITNGYRHPSFNEKIGGASQSRHIVGEAVDITARDINQDGAINQEDKNIIVSIAEEIVGNSGGVGLYPNTLSIHMDTRGHKARWNSF